MTSVISFPRRLLGLWSPRIHLMESTTLLLPLPLGPTTQVTPGAKSKRVRSAKLLKPNRSSDLSIVFPQAVLPSRSFLAFEESSLVRKDRRFPEPIVVLR